MEKPDRYLDLCFNWNSTALKQRLSYFILASIAQTISAITNNSSTKDANKQLKAAILGQYDVIYDDGDDDDDDDL